MADRAGVHVEDLYRPGSRDDGEELTVGAEDEIAGKLLPVVGLVRLVEFSGIFREVLEVPQVDRADFTHRTYPPPVGAERDMVDLVCRGLEDVGARVDVPHPKLNLVEVVLDVARHGDLSAVGAEGDR